MDAKEQKGRAKSAGERRLASEREVFVEASIDAFDFEKVRW